MNFYNEVDRYAAAWLRELIRSGDIPDGVVDERDIREIKPNELDRFVQCHFFAGIGGWSEALRLAGWPSDRPVWTGSCPCQPFSAAGRKKGVEDERHLWPAFFALIKERKPPVVFGEQVASALSWLDAVQDDMEGKGYAFGKNDLSAASVGAPHIRQRIYFVGVADYNEGRCEVEREARLHADWQRRHDVIGCGEADGKPGRMGDSSRDGDWQHAGELRRDESEHEERRENGNHASVDTGAAGDRTVALSVSERRRGRSDGDTPREYAREIQASGRGGAYELEHSAGIGQSGRRLDHGRIEASERRIEAEWGERGEEAEGRRATHGFWADCEWVSCADGKARPVKRSTPALVNGATKNLVRSGDTSLPFDADNSSEARIMRLKGYGNSICAPLAAEFIRAVMDTIEEGR